MMQSLLDDLSTLVGCLYLSDLPRPEYREKIISELSRIPKDRYPLSDWAETVYYLTKKEVSPQNPKEAIEYLKLY